LKFDFCRQKETQGKSLSFGERQRHRVCLIFAQRDRGKELNLEPELELALKKRERERERESSMGLGRVCVVRSVSVCTVLV
jgi:hypothetical protein